MEWQTWEREEMKIYQSGTPVELKEYRGQIYYIEEYDPMMVPPVWLEGYPKPCYPEELRILSNLFCFWPRRNLQVA